MDGSLPLSSRYDKLLLLKRESGLPKVIVTIVRLGVMIIIIFWKKSHPTDDAKFPLRSLLICLSTRLSATKESSGSTIERMLPSSWLWFFYCTPRMSLRGIIYYILLYCYYSILWYSTVVGVICDPLPRRYRYIIILFWCITMLLFFLQNRFPVSYLRFNGSHLFFHHPLG